MTSSSTSLGRQTYVISIISIVLASLTVVLMITADIGVAVLYHNPLMTDNVGCALKSGYGLFVVATATELFMLVFECVALCMIFSPQCGCRCERYHLRFILHYVAFVMVVAGAMIYGSGDSINIGWPFWMAICAAILAAINGMIWSITMQLDRYFNKGVSNSSKIGGGFSSSGDGNNFGGGDNFGDSGGNVGTSNVCGDMGFGDNLGGDFGGNDIGTSNVGSDLGLGDNLGGNIGGDLGGDDFGTSNVGDNIGGDLIGDEFGTSNDGGDLGLSSELDIDPILQEELKSAPDISLDLGMNSTGDTSNTILPDTQDLELDLNPSFNTAGLDISEDNDLQLDF